MRFLLGCRQLVRKMEPNTPSEMPSAFSQSLAFGIVVSAVTGDRKQKHVALIYKTFDSKVMQLHVGWHRNLCHHDWDGKYHWIQINGIDQELQETFADWAVLVAGATPGESINYSALFHPGRNFDVSGRFINRNDGTGLTCATFLLALFNDFGIPLIDANQWPTSRQGDFKWLRKILKLLRKYEVKSGRMTSWSWLEQVKRRHSLKRYRPEEVFASAGFFTGEPLEFEQLEVAGKEILRFVPA